MAHKKGAGSSKNGRESHSKRLGIKIYGGQFATAGNIIVRQRGTLHNPDKNVGIGKDHTLFALIDGTVIFRKKAKNKSYVSVLPFEHVAATEVKVAPAKKAEPVAEVSSELATETVEAKPAKAPAKKATAEKAEAKPKKAPAKKAKSEE